MKSKYKLSPSLAISAEEIDQLFWKQLKANGTNTYSKDWQMCATNYYADEPVEDAYLPLDKFDSMWFVAGNKYQIEKAYRKICETSDVKHTPWEKNQEIEQHQVLCLVCMRVQ